MNKTIEQTVTNDETSVSRLAYQLWENAGRPAGRDLEFWLAAEAKLNAASRRPIASNAVTIAAEKSSVKAGRATKPASIGAKKTWPKPYPNLPKF